MFTTLKHGRKQPVQFNQLCIIRKINLILKWGAIKNNSLQQELLRVHFFAKHFLMKFRLGKNRCEESKFAQMNGVYIKN